MRHIVNFILVLVLIQNTAFGQEVTELSIGKNISKTMRINDQHIYSIPLKKGQFALINLKQQKLDVKIITYAPDGEKIEVFDSLNVKTLRTI